MRIRTAFAVAVVAAAVSLPGAGTAVADGPDDDSNVVIIKEVYAPDPGSGWHSGNWGNGNWNSGAAFGPMIMD
ncbi:hypothetical protein [Streptomyces sp. NPDC002851]